MYLIETFFHTEESDVTDSQELPAGVGAVYPFWDKRAWRARLDVISATSGIQPVAKRSDKKVERAIFAPARTRTILNWSSARVLDRLGHPQAVMTVEVDDPRLSAELAVTVFARHGYTAELVDASGVEIGVPARFMYFVLVSPQVPLLYWPKKPNQAQLAQLTPSEPWKDEL